MLHVEIYLQITFTLRYWKLTGHVSETFKEVADISESLSMDSFSLTKALVKSALLTPRHFNVVRRSE
jgi:hypothetical protein